MFSDLSGTQEQQQLNNFNDFNYLRMVFNQLSIKPNIFLRIGQDLKGFLKGHLQIVVQVALTIRSFSIRGIKNENNVEKLPI